MKPRSLACLIRFFLFILVTVLCWGSTALALNVEVPLPHSNQEARAQALFKQLRCVVCESEAIADSPATVAKDLRAYVRTEIAAGKSDAAILESLTERYGTFILMEPPFAGGTLWLWLAPLFFLMGGIAALGYRLKN